MSVRPTARAVLIAALALAATACHRSHDSKAQGQLTTTQAPGESPAAPVLVPGLTCNPAGFLTETANPGVAKITATQVHFIQDLGDGCPSDGPACQAKAYVMKGDTVMTGVANGPYVCAFIPNKSGGSAGWVKPADIAEMTVSATPPLQTWAGTWRAGDAVITLKVNDNTLVADGTAPVPGAAAAAAATPKPVTPPAGDAAAQAVPAADTAPRRPAARRQDERRGPARRRRGRIRGGGPERLPRGPAPHRLPSWPPRTTANAGEGRGFAGVFRKPSAVSAGRPGRVKSRAASKSNPTRTYFIEASGRVAIGHSRNSSSGVVFEEYLT